MKALVSFAMRRAAVFLCTRPLERARAVKGPDELACIAQSLRSTERAVHAVRDHLRLIAPRGDRDRPVVRVDHAHGAPRVAAVSGYPQHLAVRVRELMLRVPGMDRQPYQVVLGFEGV